MIAHRGASRQAPENTVAAFRRAAELGADMVELDVRRTADGALAVHHDAVLADGRRVASVASLELPPAVPLLDAAFDACAGMSVNVEIKSDPGEAGFDPARLVVDDVVAVVRRRQDEDRVLVSSFDLEAIERLKELAPGIATAWLVVQPPPGARGIVRAGGHQALHPWFGSVTAELVAANHAEGVAVNVWTCDDPDRMRELLAWGVDGLCTNVPDIALAVRDGE